ncbi:MAG: transcriptional repressor [Actinomycetia bacterium]|nr:transcriptional repressor [Actinomycetes bacterium]
MSTHPEPTVPKTPRITKQRSALLAVLQEGDFRSAQDLHAELSQDGERVGLATVYRNLAKLVDSGEVDTRMRPDGETLYRLCNPTHHHHLVCRNCGRTVEIRSNVIEQWAQEVTKAQGYTAQEHQLELTGLCPACQSAPPQPKRD